MTVDAGTASLHATALHYGSQGWEPLPVPPHTKSPPVGGHTGYNGKPVTRHQWDRWAEHGVKISEHGTVVYDGPIEACNLGLRMPPGVVGIDIDHYNDKTGAFTIATLEAELEPLPDTYSSTSRPGTLSGISFYRIPVGVLLRTKLADVEMIQAHHRYAVVAPSVHPDGRPYIWTDPHGEQLEPDDTPNIEDLPDLPWVWVEYLRAHNKTGAANAATTIEVQTFVDTHNTGTHPRMLNGVTTALRNFTGSRHDTLVEKACWAMRDTAAGLYPAADAINVLAAWWAQVMDDPYRADTSSGEFASAILWAVGQANTDPQRLGDIRTKANNHQRDNLEGLIDPDWERTSSSTGDPAAQRGDMWEYEDLTEHVNGTYTRPQPTFLRRT